jgi:cytochrome c oxidase assembly factor CtaG
VTWAAFLPLLAVAALYEQRVATLRRKGAAVPVGRRALTWTGILLVALATAPPLHEAAEDLLTAHMAQHLLLGDLAPLALALGLSGAALRPLLAHRPVRSLRSLSHPLAALPLWIAVMVAWHLPPLYDAAVASEPLHLLEHATFFAAGLCLWMAILETLPCPAWFGTWAKAGWVVVMAAVEMGIGNALLWSGVPLYAAYPGGAGLSALEDQQLAGGVMMLEGTVVTVAVLCVLWARALAESEQRQRLLDEGVGERAAARAVRYGRTPGSAPGRTSP